MRALRAACEGGDQNADRWRLIIFPGSPSREYLFYRLLARTPSGLEVTVITRAGYGGGSYGASARPVVSSFEDQIAAAAPLLTTSGIDEFSRNLGHGDFLWWGPGLKMCA